MWLALWTFSPLLCLLCFVQNDREIQFGRWEWGQLAVDFQSASPSSFSTLFYLSAAFHDWHNGNNVEFLPLAQPPRLVIASHINISYLISLHLIIILPVRPPTAFTPKFPTQMVQARSEPVCGLAPQFRILNF